MDQLPSKAQILDWIAQNPSLSAKRDIVRAFGIKGSAARIELKRLLREMEAEGALEKRKRTFTPQGALPPVSVLEIVGPDAQGDLFARPLEWAGEGQPPRILFVAKKGDPALAQGERILARLTEVEGEDEGHTHEARLIRRLGGSKPKILGIFRASDDGGRILPIDKGEDKEWRVARDGAAGARDGELVEAEQAGPRRLGLPLARITARLGDPAGPRAVSLIAIHQHGIPDSFPDAVLAEAEAAGPAPMAEREDLRHLPFVTIDPVDARDRDDAVLAEPDPDPQNPGGHILWVAIADVAHYVRPGSALDREARRRGNSTYFPDRVVPMLPDALSGDLCSLHQEVDRPCMAVRMRLSAQGEKLSHRFTRGMMRSRASLNYAQVQKAQDGQPDEATAPLLETIIRPLYEAYAALKHARALRQPLELDLPERRIELSDEGRVLSVAFRDRFDAHRLIEEFMVLANVAAAEELVRLRRPLLFRVHEEPSADKLEALREVAEASGFTLAKGQVLKTAHLNRLLAQAQGTEFDELMNITTLRSMTQAYYHPENFGHFGLALRSYAHFTSPIRRYSDLIVHRALILGHGWGDDGLSAQDIEMLEETAKQISDTERRSMAAERDTTDRYLASWLSDRVGAEFTGRISGVQRFGLFVKLDESGADGLIPIRSVGREFFHFDPESQTLMGSDTGLVLGIGQRVTVRLAEAVPLTGGLMLELLTVEDRGLPAPKRRRGRSAPRKPGREAAKAGKVKRRVLRTRR
ncbi:ribonuclease R [Cereibacter sphaeroides]|uniref:Ribonuclease R n=1 Tax=Cereibacter sphaeroides TaxID=1063 RepID=A0AAX1UGL4_CERSP|nr:ribonuclease R [Cereibacter sphaeroides]AZB62455.1 ribonuclease R [Cereibacter sphaeroides]AZB69594.1 ribonuclease R [Cereibacter sphaeroides]RHZ91733.1 ribonuclease R [Cereibacter sphaeroides]